MEDGGWRMEDGGWNHQQFNDIQDNIASYPGLQETQSQKDNKQNNNKKQKQTQAATSLKQQQNNSHLPKPEVSAYGHAAPISRPRVPI